MDQEHDALVGARQQQQQAPAGLHSPAAPPRMVGRVRRHRGRGLGNPLHAAALTSRRARRAPLPSSLPAAPWTSRARVDARNSLCTQRARPDVNCLALTKAMAIVGVVPSRCPGPVRSAARACRSESWRVATYVQYGWPPCAIAMPHVRAGRQRPGRCQHHVQPVTEDGAGPAGHSAGHSGARANSPFRYSAAEGAGRGGAHQCLDGTAREPHPAPAAPNARRMIKMRGAQRWRAARSSLRPAAPLCLCRRYAKVCKPPTETETSFSKVIYPLPIPGD